MARHAKQTFTKATIGRLPKGSAAGTWYTHAEIRNFSLRILDDGSRYFVVRFIVKDAGPRRHVVTLGRWGVVTYEQAYRKAKELLAKASLGEDPRPRRALTWGEWTERYLARLDVKRPEEHARYFGRTAEKSKKTGEETDSTFRDLARKWANRLLSAFTVEDIAAARQEIRQGGKVKAARWLATIAACFAAAVNNGLLDSNPAAQVKADRPNPSRDRVLSADEMKALLLAADAETDPHARAAIFLLCMTGARSGEILAAEWSHVDLDARRIRLPDSKSGKPRLIALPPRAVELLRSLPRFGKYVIAGARADRPKADLKSVWRRIASRAGLVGVNPHDVRRSHGLELVRLVGVRLASLALGHESIAVTESTYSPEAFSAIQDATDRRAALLPMPEEEKKPEEGGRP
jgi:integrase